MQGPLSSRFWAPSCRVGRRADPGLMDRRLAKARNSHGDSNARTCRVRRVLIFLGPCKNPKGTNTKVTSAKGHFCAYPNHVVTVPETPVHSTQVCAVLGSIRGAATVGLACAG